MKSGDAVGDYVVEELIGQGGVATVYRVRHAESGGRYALKVLHTASSEVRKRLEREARTQAALDHVNVVTVHELMEIKGDAGVLMEFVDGPSMDVWLANQTPDRDEAVRLFKQICAGVAHAHERGLVHRDLKPSNILLEAGSDDSDMVPKITDFGLVKAMAGDLQLSGPTNSGIAMGTPGYMPPEQVRDASGVDHRTDLFALGAILYELLHGSPAFDGKTILEKLNNVASGKHEPIDPDVPKPLADLIRKLLVPEPERRLGTMKELNERLANESLLLGGGDEWLSNSIGPIVPTLTTDVAPMRQTEPEPEPAAPVQHEESTGPSPWLLAAGAVVVILALIAFALR